MRAEIASSSSEGLPYYLRRRLVAIAILAALVPAMLIPLVGTGIALSALAGFIVVWLGIAAKLRDSGAGSYLLAGAFAPAAAAPLAVGFHELISAATDPGSGTLDQVVEQALVGVLRGFQFAPWILILTFPFGMIIGGIAHYLMRREACY